MNEYEVTFTVRVQGDGLDDVPALMLEAMSDHDVWPVTVQNLDDPSAQPVEIWMDKNTGLRTTI